MKCPKKIENILITTSQTAKWCPQIAFCVQQSKTQRQQNEVAELTKCNKELEDGVEMKKAAYKDEIAVLEVWEWMD